MLAKLIKHEADGTPIGIRSTIPLGTIYEILMDSKRMHKWGDYSQPDNIWDLESVLAKRPEMDNFEWQPLEIFEVISESSIM